MEGDTASVVDENEVNFDGLMGGINEMEMQVRRMSTFGMGMEIRISDHARPEELEKKQQICALVLLCYIVHSSHLLRRMSRYTCSSTTSDENSESEQRCVQLMTQLEYAEKCRDIIRMSPQAFLQLCEKLRSSSRMKDSTTVTVEGQVAEFLYIVGRDAKNRTVPFLFHQSRETFNRRFHNVLRGIILLYKEFVAQPSGVDVPPQILNDNNFYPCFKDCIGAIGAIHSRVKVPMKDAPRYCGRKGYPTQLVFAACNFDMKFTYLLVGWEGSASYPRVLGDALNQRNLKVPEGKFYLGRAGFTPKPGVLTPYTGVRCHLKEYSTQGPQNYKELFNLRHSLLLNVIEKTFGVLKKRFPIIAGDNETFFSVITMRDIIIACCVLHNFLMGIDIDEQIIAEVDCELLRDKDRFVPPKRKRDGDYVERPSLRKNIALEMWNAYEVQRAECIPHVPSY